MKPRILTSLVWGLGALGLGVSFLLLMRTLALAAGASGDFAVCSWLSEGGCDAALQATQETVLGLPWAGWGVVVYGTFLGVLGLEWWIGPAFSRSAHWAALVVLVPAAATGLFLSWRLLTGTDPACPLCLLVHGSSVVLVGVCALRLGVPAGPSLEAPPWQALGLLCAVLGAGLLYQWVLLQHRAAPPRVDGDLERAVRRWEAQAAEDLEVRPDDPALGAEGAPAQVVVFASLQCPGCDQLIRFLRDLLRQVGADMQIHFKHYPLGSACNPTSTVDMHPHACAAARAAEAARLQDRFWPYQDALHEAGFETGEEVLWTVGAQLGLDVDRLREDAASEATEARISADIALGTRLGFEGTPALYVNGRAIRELQTDVIEAVIDRASEMPGPDSRSPR